MSSQCPECGGIMNWEHITLTYERGGVALQIKGVPAWVCAECGKDTEVPFEPRGDKPVYCSDCYRKVVVSR